MNIIATINYLRYNTKLSALLMRTILLSIIIITIFSCKTPKHNTLLCDQYKDTYLNDESHLYTLEDSLASKDHFDFLIKLSKGNLFVKYPYVYPLLYRIKNTDTSLINHVYQLYYDNPKEFDQEIGINFYLARAIINSDAVIKGKVILKDDYSDSCLFFTTTYYIRVDSVIHSYFPIKKNDTVILKTNLFGHVGGCSADSSRKYSYHSTTHSSNYNLNQTSNFFLNRASYIKQYNDFVFGRYEDEFCYNSFRMDNNNSKKSLLLKESNKIKLAEFIESFQDKP